jgi:hypothetical protein
MSRTWSEKKSGVRVPFPSAQRATGTVETEVSSTGWISMMFMLLVPCWLSFGW